MSEAQQNERVWCVSLSAGAQALQALTAIF